jgi:Zn-dependent protease
MQVLVGLPLVIYISVFGFTRFTPLNVAMGVFGYYSLFVAALNLLPIRPLDGAKAWYVVRMIFQKRQGVATKRSTGWRSYRWLRSFGPQRHGPQDDELFCLAAAGSGLVDD